MEREEEEEEEGEDKSFVTAQYEDEDGRPVRNEDKWKSELAYIIQSNRKDQPKYPPGSMSYTRLLFILLPFLTFLV
jgi:hypothetical protein